MGGFVGDVLDTVTNVVDDVVDSDLGKAAILAGTAYATGGGSLASMSMPTLGQVGSAMQIAGGINSLTGGGITNALGGGKAVSQATNAADPMAPYRQNLASMYAGALQPGTNLDPTQMPGYSQFETGVLNPALEATKRSGAASGIMRSGNEQIALQKVAQQGYSGFMADYLNRLAGGAGVAQSPVVGYNAGTQAQAGIMQGIGGIGTGIAGIFGKGSTPTDYGYTVDTSGYGIGSGGMGTVNTADYGGASGYSIR